jgi:hypothetical protein
MQEKGSGGSQGPFQDSPIFGKKRMKMPGLPKIPGIKLPTGGRKPLALLIAVLVVLAFVYNFLLVYVGPNEYGIKEVQIGIFTKRGIQEKVYDTGLHLRITGMEVMHKFPRDVSSGTPGRPTSRPPTVSSWMWMCRSCTVSWIRTR